MTAAALRRKLERIGKRVPTARVAHVLEIEDGETADEALARFNVAHSGKGYVLGVPAPNRSADEEAAFMQRFHDQQVGIIVAARRERTLTGDKPVGPVTPHPLQSGAKPVLPRFQLKRSWRPNICHS